VLIWWCIFICAYYFILWDECQCYLLAFSYSLQFTTVLVLYCCIVLWVGSITKYVSCHPCHPLTPPLDEDGVIMHSKSWGTNLIGVWLHSQFWGGRRVLSVVNDCRLANVMFTTVAVDEMNEALRWLAAAH